MAKADVKRDYYADLGLTPSADAEDIKKQFRKLALKYHPDRNPGQELEYNAKFQAIQAAHEILSDPQQRLKYDTDRLRAGYGKLYGPPKSNNMPRRAPTATYPPSPTAKPTPPKTQFANRSSSFQNGPFSGAQRYTSYTRTGSQQHCQKTPDASQTRADAYRAFQEMKNNGAQMPGWSSFDPWTGRASYQAGNAKPAPSPGGQSTKPKSAYEYFKTTGKPADSERFRSQFTRRKQGFAPAAATGGDEPMARNTSAYTSTPRGERPQPTGSFFESAPAPTAKNVFAAEDTASGTHADQSTIPEFERTSSRYARAGDGQRTFFSSAWLGRSASTRESPGAHSRTTPPSPTSSQRGRHRSASFEYKTGRDRTFSDSISSSGSDDEIDRVFRRPKQSPKSGFRSSYYTSSNAGAQQDWKPSVGHDSDSAAFPSGGSFRFRSAAESPSAGLDGTREDPARTNVPGATRSPFNPANAPQSASDEHLHRKFTAEDWSDGGFQFLGGTAPGTKNARRTKTQNGRGRPATRQNSSYATNKSSGSSPDKSSRSNSVPQQPPTPFQDAKFSMDSWVEQPKNVSFGTPPLDVSQPQNPQPGNPSSSRAFRKSSRSAMKVRPVPRPATVTSEAEETDATLDERTNGVDADGQVDDGEAMDIDEEVPAAQTASHSAPHEPGEGQAPTRPHPSAKPPHSGSGGQQEDPSERVLNMKKMSNMTPFTSTNDAGLDDLQDVRSTLPFESRPKPPQPTNFRSVRPRELSCPKPPKRPRAPEPVPASACSQLRVLPRQTWDRYVAEMNVYMREWKDFNRRMLLHFNARQAAIETGLAPNWISAVGDSSKLKMHSAADSADASFGNGVDDDDDYQADAEETLVPGTAKGGYAAYLRGLEEDFKAREHWDVACEMHRDCILELGRLREWIRNGGKVV